MTKTIIILLLFIVSIVTGFVKTEILDDLKLDTAIGYDYAGKNKVRGTAVFPVYNLDKSVSSETYTETSILSKEILTKMDAISPKTVEPGKLGLALFSKELAEHGIFDLVDNFQRDASISTNLLLAVVDGDAKEILSLPYKNEDTGMHITSILDQNIKLGLLPNINLHRYMYAYYSDGMDPHLPLFKLKNDQIKISGIALFDKDKFVDQINSEETYIFTVLYESSKNGSYRVHMKKGSDAYVRDVNTKRDFRVVQNKTSPEITVDVQIDGIIREYSGKRIIEKEAYKKIEQKMEHDVKIQAEKMIRKFQTLKIDPLGLGQQVRSRTKNWDVKTWNKMYPTVKVNVKADVKITESGVVE